LYTSSQLIEQHRYKSTLVILGIFYENVMIAPFVSSEFMALYKLCMYVLYCHRCLYRSCPCIGTSLQYNWKHAVGKAVYKNGSASCVSNYRHISLTCVASKLVKHVIVNKILNFRRANKVTSEHHAARFLSTTNNELESISDWIQSINNKMSLGVAYIWTTNAHLIAVQLIN